MNKTIGNFQIEWIGFKKVLIHTLWATLATLIASGISLLIKHDFGIYNTIAIPVLSFIGILSEKFFASYEIPFIINK